jgi:hypothetical protein
MPNVFQGVALVAAIGLTQLQDANKPRIRKRRDVAAGEARARDSNVPRSETAEVEQVPLR